MLMLMAFALKTKRFAFHNLSGISVNSEQKNILRTITHPIQYNAIQYTVLEIQFRSVKYTAVTVGYAKMLKRCRRLQWVDENKPLQKAFERI